MQREQPKPVGLRHGGVTIELLPRAAYDVGYTPNVATIGFAFETQSGSHAFASSKRVPFRTRPNSLAYVPAGCDVASASGEGGEYLTLPAGLDLPTGAAERRFNDRVSVPAVKAAHALRRAALTNLPVEPLEVEAAALTLRMAVARALTGAEPHPKAARWMTPRRLRLVDEMIEARMEEGVSVKDLAAALGLSEGFFARAFKAATGMPPHAYATERRLSRARVMLRGSKTSAAEVAAACGFASQAHLCAVFRRKLGAPPGWLRAKR